MADEAELDAWLHELCAALGLPAGLAAHRQLLLNVARDAAHNVMRPAAPLTTFLVGFAAGRATALGQPVEVSVSASAATAAELALSRA